MRINFGERVASAWDCLAIGAVRADVWRLAVLYVHGGYYFDMDAGPQPKHPFRSWGTENLSFVSGLGRTIREPHQWGMVYAPQHPILRLALQKTLPQLALQHPRAHVMDIAYKPFQRAYKTLHQAGNHSTVPGWGDMFGGRVYFKLPGGFDKHLRGTAGVRHWAHVEQHGGRLWKQGPCC
eukprot:m.202373 g.202373  ORF g.202373 m.202373 type:complete len:180 (-) comp21752_c0_seq1:83-622(-)